jgi:hypothetical protein
LQHLRQPSGSGYGFRWLQLGGISSALINPRRMASASLNLDPFLQTIALQADQIESNASHDLRMHGRIL